VILLIPKINAPDTVTASPAIIEKVGIAAVMASLDIKDLVAVIAIVAFVRELCLVRVGKIDGIPALLNPI